MSGSPNGEWISLTESPLADQPRLATKRQASASVGWSFLVDSRWSGSAAK